MSEFVLAIGEAYDHRRSALCLTHLSNLGLVKRRLIRGFSGINAVWTEAHNKIDSIRLLNLATVCVFLDYAVELLGRPMNELMQDPILGNLPWWMDSLWAPVDFAPPMAFQNDPDGPFFFGSVPGLLSALEIVKSKSILPLGDAPPAYDLMRSDPESFDRTFERLADNDQCIQWIWRASMMPPHWRNSISNRSLETGFDLSTGLHTSPQSCFPPLRVALGHPCPAQLRPFLGLGGTKTRHG